MSFDRGKETNCMTQLPTTNGIILFRETVKIYDIEHTHGTIDSCFSRDCLIGCMISRQ